MHHDQQAADAEFLDGNITLEKLLEKKNAMEGTEKLDTLIRLMKETAELSDDEAAQAVIVMMMKRTAELTAPLEALGYMGLMELVAMRMALAHTVRYLAAHGYNPIRDDIKPVIEQMLKEKGGA